MNSSVDTGKYTIKLKKGEIPMMKSKEELFYMACENERKAKLETLKTKVDYLAESIEKQNGKVSDAAMELMRTDLNGTLNEIHNYQEFWESREMLLDSMDESFEVLYQNAIKYLPHKYALIDVASLVSEALDTWRHSK
jgi:hypothetical protein